MTTMAEALAGHTVLAAAVTPMLAPHRPLGAVPARPGVTDPQLCSGYWNHPCGCGVTLPRHLARCHRCARAIR